MTDRDQPADDGTDLSSGSGASVGPALRSRAEESLRRQSSLRVARAEAVLPESAQRTLHELRVSQIELEMQNEELRSAQVALEEARARNVELYDLAPVGYCTVSRQGLILEANLTAATLLDIRRTTLIGQPLSRYITSDDAERFHLQRRQILDTGEPLAGELRMSTAAGKPFWAQLAASAAAAADGTPALYVVFSDVTARKQAELELARHRDHLEDLVQERTAALAVARDLAEAASRAKSSFLSTMSHELRTPMAGVMGMLELAARRSTDSKTREYLGKALGAAQSLLAIINDILDLSRIEADRLRLDCRRFTLGSLLAQLRSLAEPLANAKGIALRVHVPAALAEYAVLGDDLRLGQILLNLTGNAIKFTPAGSVSVRVTLSEEPGDALCLRCEIVDTGIGIAAADQVLVFEPFEQADRLLTRQYGGSGLGLAISRRLAHLMDGEIGLSSEVGVGSVFWCTVRLRKAADAAAPVAAPAADERAAIRHRGKRILLVEDDAVSREIVRELLEHAGFVVETAEDGWQAVVLATTNSYHLVLMDLAMPNVDGFEATRLIRALPECADLPIVALTAYAFDEDRARCLVAGMNDHLTKPVIPDALFGMVDAWLDR
ncbi:MAG: response regulator [Candidatus Accumulibacter sp.]|uniref:PAS domain-containing hybrid sensor histidine kinase/response regulator n=1 Tax=Accumulibacter sp. TaxID=2053492 RepID=UPI001AD348B6|nr:response regulator [Accumulibacter sp.]MBN8437171.1 response regulator [Accumulibacter sp.]